MMKKPKFPQFDRYACVGDRIHWSAEGFDFAAFLEADTDTSVDDFDCYSEKTKNAWRNDEWFFVGVVLTVSRNGVVLSDYTASLWGIDCNFPSRRKNPNWYLSDVARDLQGEVLTVARTEQARIVGALQA